MSRYVSLAGVQVAELGARATDAGRLSRGRVLFQKGSVGDLAVFDGSIVAAVRGSDGSEYETTVGTAPAPPGVVRQIAQAGERSLDQLIEDEVDVCPRDIDLVFDCNCPDWAEPCKHVVALLLAFADRVDLDPQELLRWRAVDPDRATDQESPPSSDAAADRSARLSELESLLGDTAVRVPSPGPASNEPVPPPTDPVLADFLGIGTTITPIDVSAIAQPAPLFANISLGPLAQLGPELAKAIAAVTTTSDRAGNRARKTR